MRAAKSGSGRWLSLAQAVALIKPGARIYLSHGSATPLAVMPALVDPNAALGDNEIVHLLTLGAAPYIDTEWRSRFRHNALFIGSNTRRAVTEGRADYTPIFLSEIPSLLRSGRLAIDVAILTLSPPDDGGYCSFGTHVDVGPAAAESAGIVIGAINRHMPRVPSPARIHVDQLTALVEADHPLPELPVDPPTDLTRAIGQNVADLVPDGATLQVGIGATPNAVLECLRRHSDLGIHSELVSDGVIELARSGVITGARKSIHAGKMVSAFVMGSQQCYDFVRDNAALELYPADYTNDPFVIGQHDNMVAINTGLEIDLTGQVCSDSIGERFYSGIGGQVDFIRGAARSKGGRPILAIPSTAQSGVISRIVPRLSRGAGVVTTRGDVHWIVTEWGSVNLHGLSVRERALALISVAHPRFRPWLLAEAKRSKFVHADQLEPPMETPIYPRRLESRATLVGVGELLIRPVKVIDESLLHELFYGLSQETTYRRFCGVIKYFPHENLQRFCTVDYARDMTLVAVRARAEVEHVVGLATYHVDASTGFAEFGMVVSDALQGKGVGKLLMQAMVQAARQHGVKGFSATVLGQNSAMLRVFESTGFRPQVTADRDGFRVWMPF